VKSRLDEEAVPGISASLLASFGTSLFYIRLRRITEPFHIRPLPYIIFLVWLEEGDDWTA